MALTHALVGSRRCADVFVRWLEATNHHRNHISAHVRTAMRSPNLPVAEKFYLLPLFSLKPEIFMMLNFNATAAVRGDGALRPLWWLV